MKPKKLHIINTNYDEKRHLVSWLVRDTENNKEFTLAWLDEDLGEQFGIKRRLPPEIVREFCKNMEGKTFNWVSQGTIDVPANKKLKKASQEEILKEHEKIDHYPFREVIEKMNEEENES